MSDDPIPPKEALDFSEAPPLDDRDYARLREFAQPILSLATPGQAVAALLPTIHTLSDQLAHAVEQLDGLADDRAVEILNALPPDLACIVTGRLVDHVENYDGPCECGDCRSYGDPNV